MNPRYGKIIRRREKRTEQGSALLAALCLIFMAGMLTGTVLALSRISTFDVRAHVALQRSAYVNEGVANRIQFLLAADRNVYSESIDLGELDYTEYDHDRFAADGTSHIIDYHGTEVQVTINDAASGFNMDNNGYRQTLNRIVNAFQLDDTSISDQMQTLNDRITDYIDTDDNQQDDGLEAQDYETEKMEPLPRNGYLRYREELLFIPGITEFFKPDRYGMLSCVRLITPYGMTSINANGSNPNFFTADRFMLKVQGMLEDDEIDDVIEAREEWFKNRTKLSEQLDALLLSRLQQNFSFRESGFFTIRIEAPEKSGRPSRRLIFTYPAFDISGPTNDMVRYYDWLML
ncbi:MAG: general secretion pathway protein GspK [Lentisphaeria bacterium]|nr:general secretion pathway protein GspK [Lentisphaeria bacterium]